MSAGHTKWDFWLTLPLILLVAPCLILRSRWVDGVPIRDGAAAAWLALRESWRASK